MKGALPFALVCCLALPEAAAAQQEPATDGDAGSSFLDGLQWQVMASGFYLFNAHRVTGAYNELGYPYTNYMGFGLNFAGGDLSYTGEKFALTIGLRFGTAAPLLSALAPLKQGFVSWFPHRKLALDFGWFDTIFGAEVADEWQNPTFTRGALYFLQQPFNHMGIRMGATLTEKVTLKFLLVNNRVRVGELGGSPTAGVETPSIGAQLNVSPADALTLQVGYMAGAGGQSGNRAWGQFFDLILTAKIERFTLIFNGSATLDSPARSGQYSYGMELQGDMLVHDHWKVGARVEYLGGTVDVATGLDPDLLTVTAIVRYLPVQHLVISLEPRFELSQQDLFFTRGSPTDPSTGDRIANSGIYFGLVLGVSAYIGN